MPKPMLLKLVRKEAEREEDRGEKAPVLLGPRTKLLLVLRRLGSTSRGYALAGAGVMVGAVVVVSLLSWLAPDSDRPIASPLEAVGRIAGGVLEQVDDQVEALLGTDGENTVLRSVREGLAAASSATPWPGNPVGIAAGPSSGTASPDSASPSTDGAAAPSREESSSASNEGPSRPASSTPAGSSEAPSVTDAPSPPATSEPAPPASEEPPVVEEPSSPPDAEEPPAPEDPPPPAEEPAPPTSEEPPPVAEEPSPVPSDPPPAEEPPQTIPAQ